VPEAFASGVMIAYATAPGRTASDRGDGSGPYARILAEEIVKPGIEAMTMFRNVALRVKNSIGQDPWLSASTLQEVFFAGKTESERGAASDGKPPVAFDVTLFEDDLNKDRDLLKYAYERSDKGLVLNYSGNYLTSLKTNVRTKGYLAWAFPMLSMK